MIPKYFFLTKGVGKHKEQLQSFELALRDAGIQHCNIVSVSSIVPPGCKLIPREKGLQLIRPGEITFVVLARNSTSEPHRLVASSIGVAIPSGKNSYGYLSEHHSFGQPDDRAGDYAEDLAATMLAIFIVPVLFVTITKIAYSKEELAELKRKAEDLSSKTPFLE